MTAGIAVSDKGAESLSPAEIHENAASFRSILFDSGLPADIGLQEAPGYFADLNLDQIIESITAGRGEYNLKPFFYFALSRIESIHYRYEILRDLESRDLCGSILSFAEKMRTMRRQLGQADKLYYKLQRQGWFLDAVEIYCDAVAQLARDLARMSLGSRGFLSFRTYLESYINSDPFVSLVAETQKLKSDLSAIQYSLLIEGKRIEVVRYGFEPDYSADVLKTFEKFKEGVSKEYRFHVPSGPDMNHVEAAILNLVAQSHFEIFSALDEYCTRHGNYLDGIIAGFDREVQFYMAYLEYIEPLKKAGLPFCHAVITDRSKQVRGSDVYDLALANKLTLEGRVVVKNDFCLNDPERILVVSGPNQGGKTTFARAFGQIHHLAAIGCPVPGREARLFLFDRLFTHFEREEDLRNLSGKLEDDLMRIHRIFDLATSNSILIMNESFLSTTLKDALFLSKEIMNRVIALDMLCVSVTFLDELASLGRTTVSMVSQVAPGDPAVRTFKIIRKPSDGLAYAISIAEKYGLTYQGVQNRIAANRKGQVAS